MYTLVITHPEQEEHLTGAHPGVYVEADTPLAVGDAVIFCRATSLDPPGYFASAQVRSIEAMGVNFLVVGFTPIRVFHLVIAPSSAELLAARIRVVPDGYFADIAALGGDWTVDASRAPEMALGFAESGDAEPFESEPVAGDDVDGAILDAYGWRCAFTGQPVDRGDVLDVRPVDRGGRRSRRNSLPAIAAIRDQVTKGHVTVGAGGEFWVKKDRIDPELEEALNPLGRLLSAEPARADINAAAWAWHRRNVFDAS